MVIREIPVIRDGEQITTQSVHLLDSRTAFKLTAIERRLETTEEHLRRFLCHTQLSAIQWVNLHHHDQGDVALIDGHPFPKTVGQQRKLLEERIARQGFEQTIEAVAYTWFNRLVAIRFMEIHGYLEHGYRVLSPATDETRTKHGNASVFNPCSIRGSTLPEILDHAEHVDLPGLDPQQVIDLKLSMVGGFMMPRSFRHETLTYKANGDVLVDARPTASLDNRSDVLAAVKDSLGGSIIPVENLAGSLQVAFDAGAKRILLPMASVSDIPTIPGELFATFQTSFYSDPSDAVFKALGVE